MTKPNKVLKETCETYLEEIQRLDFKDISGKLGLSPHEDGFLIRCLNRNYIVSGRGIHTMNHEKASYDIFIILSRYLLMCPAVEPPGGELAAFRQSLIWMQNVWPFWEIFFAGAVNLKRLLCQSSLY